MRPGLRVEAEVSLARIRRNFDLVVSRAEAAASELAGAVAMVKANAYGHGALEVSRALESRSRTLGFGVAGLEEGEALRAGGIRKPIWVFSGAGPWTDEIVGRLNRSRLTPVIYTLEDLRLALEPRYRGWLRKAGFHLKFNTGMNRLGIPSSEAARVRRWLESARAVPQGICGHFASGEQPGAAVTRIQVQRFEGVLSELSNLSVGEIAYIHGSNTGAVFSGRRLGLAGRCNVVRPGIGIYGYGGLAGARAGLSPALVLRAQVVQSRVLARGDSVGYGATFRAARAMPQAVLAIGYGDGLMRNLSNKRLLVQYQGRMRECGVAGRVSMDLTSLGLKAGPGDWVTLLGADSRQGERMAEAAGTIIYEVLTMLSPRVPRVYR